MAADPQWSLATNRQLQAAGAGVDAIAEAFVRDGDDDAAVITREVGVVLLGCTAALCAAIADLAAALRDRPTR